MSRIRAHIVALITSISTAGLALAQDAEQSRATAFRAVTGPQADQVPGGTLLIVAYAIVWALLFLYLFRIGRLQTLTRDEIEKLEKRLGKRSSSD